MEALCVQPLVEDGVMMDECGREKSGEVEVETMEASSPVESTTDEETDEDSEPEPPRVVRRKVSFADAFGLNLVSVKEFDNVEVTEAEVSQSPEGEATRALREFYMTCLFTGPATPEELDNRLETQMIELESIEFLPGTTTLRGTIRVVNLCYSKFVYARISLDRWNSYFDLLAEYVPGSSDSKTDRFTFKYTLVPPFGRDGTRVEFCLRYETPVGTFWANNKDMNYILFCHQKGQTKECAPQVAEESGSHKSTRSCLKAKRRGNTEGNVATAPDGKTAPRPEVQSQLHCEERGRSVESTRNQHRATRSACVKDCPSQGTQQIPKTYSPDSAAGRKVSQPSLAPVGNSAGFFYKRQKKHPNEVLTYHQIPLLTLDWNNDKRQERDNSDTDDFWTGGGKLTLARDTEESMEDKAPGDDMWETLLNGTGETTDKGTSVCDVWQAFLNGPHCKDYSGVPESEWLQTAASVSPSNDKESHNRYASSSQGFQEFQVGLDTPTALHAHTSAACQLLSAARETLLANVALNTEDQHPAEGCGRSTSDDNTVTRDASQRSHTKSVTDTPQEFSLKGATPVSEGSVDSSTKCHKRAIWERERKGIIGEAEAIGEDEPFTPHIAGLVTSSGESKTTYMTAMPGSQNARTVDRISQRARLHEGLSCSGERDVTGTAHNAEDDTLAFKETIRQGTKDGEGFLFSTSRQGAEERIVTNCTENKVSTEEKEELFRPLEMEECEISQRYVDETEREEFRLNQKSQTPLQENEGNENEVGPAQSHADDFKAKQICGEMSALKSKTGECDLVADQTEEGKRSNGIVGLLREINPSPQTTRTVFQSDHDRFRPCLADKRIPDPVEVMELRRTHSQKDEEIMAKENVAQKGTSTPLQRQRREEYMSQRDKDERVNLEKLKIEAMGESMGNVDDPWEERKNVPAEPKEQELSAEVERHQPVECKILSKGTKGPVTAENTVAHEVIEARLKEMLMERFAEDLVRGICEAVFGRKVQDTNVGGAGLRVDVPDIAPDCHLLYEKDRSDAVDSGVFSLTDLSADPNLSLCQGPQPTVETKSNEQPEKGKTQSLTTRDQTHFLFQLQADLNSSAHLSQDLSATLASHGRPSLTKSAPALSPPKDQEDCHQIKDRSVTGRQAGVVQSKSHTSHKHLISEKLKEPDGLVWWSVLYMLSHITRLLICAVLVVGFFVVVVLYDLPAFFALYIFSLCWWCCK